MLFSHFDPSVVLMGLDDCGIVGVGVDGGITGRVSGRNGGFDDGVDCAGGGVAVGVWD